MSPPRFKFRIGLLDLGEYEIDALEPGRLMAKFYLAFETMASFAALRGEEEIPGVLKALCGAKELIDSVQLRRTEKKGGRKGVPDALRSGEPVEHS